MSYAGGSIAWRLPIALQIVFAIPAMILIFGLPESPRWLYAKGRKEEAIHGEQYRCCYSLPLILTFTVLCTLFNETRDGPEVSLEIQQIEDVLNLENDTAKADRSELHVGRRIFLAWGVQVCRCSFGAVCIC